MEKEEFEEYLKKEAFERIERWLRNEVLYARNLYDDLEEQGEDTDYAEGVLFGLDKAWNIVQVCKVRKIKV